MNLPVVTFEALAGGVTVVASGESLSTASLGLPGGAYTTLRTYHGDRVLRLPQHVARLNDSAALMDSPGALDEPRVREALAASLQATGHPESRVRLTYSPPRLFVSVEALKPLPEPMYREGVACTTIRLERRNPHAKDTRFITVAAEAQRKLPPGIHEGLMVSYDGAILEGLSSNFFAVRGGVLHTEDQRALLGVTRSVALEVAGGVLPVSVTPPLLDEIPTLQECFITSASREILPVVRIDRRTIAEGRPGRVTRDLMRLFGELVEREAASVMA